MTKEYTIISIILFIGVLGLIYIFYPNRIVNANKLEIGNTDFGKLYIDTKSIETVKKDDVYYLVVNAEEYYTDKKFLNELHKNENLKNAIGATYLYMFSSDGKYYCVPQSYLFDKEEKICLNLGSDLNLKTIDKDILVSVYSKSLDVLSEQKRLYNMFKLK